MDNLLDTLKATRINGTPLLDRTVSSVLGVGTSTEIGLSDGSKLILLRNEYIPESQPKPINITIRDNRGRFIKNEVWVFGYKGEKDTDYRTRWVFAPREFFDGKDKFMGIDLDSLSIKTFLKDRVIPYSLMKRKLSGPEITELYDKGLIK